MARNQLAGGAVALLDRGKRGGDDIDVMRKLPLLLILACVTLSACCGLRDGVIVKKSSRIGPPDVYAEEFGFRYEPSVYWVQVKGRDEKGRECRKEIILFRHDWAQLRVGDHWSRQGGFSPAEAGGK
jgi:hypothetical protein